MILDDTNIKILEKAVERLGVTKLCSTLGISNSAYYVALKRKRGFTPDVWCRIIEIARDEKMPGNAAGVATEPSHDISHNDAGLLRLLYQELPKLSETNLAKVYRYVVELQIKQESE